MAEDIKIVWGSKPARSGGGGRSLKWAPVLREIVDEPQTDDDGNTLDARVATRATSTAASGIAQTIRKTADKIGVDVTVSARADEEGDEYGVWVTPGSNGSSPKSASKGTKSKGSTKSASKSTKSSGAKSSGGRRRRSTSKSS